MPPFLTLKSPRRVLLVGTVVVVLFFLRSPSQDIRRVVETHAVYRDDSMTLNDPTRGVAAAGESLALLPNLALRICTVPLPFISP